MVRTVYEEHGFIWDGAGYHADLDDLAGAFEAFWVAEARRRRTGGS